MNLANAVVAVGGTSDTLTRMAANMQRVETVGRATAMDVRQFGIAGIDVYALLAESTGRSIDRVKEMDVTYEQLSAALSMSASKGGLYYGALENARNSMQGKWSNFQRKNDQYTCKNRRCIYALDYRSASYWHRFFNCWKLYR
ncbi:hypothetical protein [Flavobacterium sp. GNP001]